MRSTQIVAWGIAIMLMLVGCGGCRYLWGMGEAAAKGRSEVSVTIPQLTPKKQP